MVDETDKRDRFNWLLLLYAGAGALLVFVPIAICSPDFGELFYVFIFTPLAILILLVVAIRRKGRQRLSVLLMLAVYCGVSFGLVKNFYDVRTAGRWLLWSKSYKAKVLAEASSANGDLRHVEWDSWGFLGSDTVVYLVFDPDDSLLTAAKGRSSGKFNGVPCEVVRVRHLEAHWYSILFYTDTDWDRCSQETR
jgi:hypothetical protein